MKSRQKKSHKKSQQTHHRKADISINTIIIAALGLLVLVVLIAVFTGRLGIFTQEVGQQQTGLPKCIRTCQALGMNGELKESCALAEEQMFGVFKDQTGVDKACCCIPRTS